MRPTVLIAARRNNANALTLEHRKWQRSEIENDMMRIVIFADLGHPRVARNRCNNKGLLSLWAIKIREGVCRRPRRQDGPVLGTLEPSKLRRVKTRRMGA